VQPGIAVGANIEDGHVDERRGMSGDMTAEDPRVFAPDAVLSGAKGVNAAAASTDGALLDGGLAGDVQAAMGVKGEERKGLLGQLKDKLPGGN
jgi:hypothetical protein